MLYVRFKWSSFDASLRKLRKLDRKQGKAIWRKALRAGGSVLLRAARPLVPTRTKQLRKSLAVRIKARRRDGILVAIVGPRTKQPGQPSKRAHLVERGRMAWRKGRRAAGHVLPRPFIARATREQQAAVFQAIIDKIREELRKL